MFARLTLLTILGVSLISCEPALQNDQYSLEVTIHPASEELLNEMAETERFSGVALVMQGDRLAHANAYGPADDMKQNELGTVIHVGSITKQFTAAAIMQLVEAKTVDLDTTINRYLPAGYRSENWQPVTARHLLSHTSGVADYGVTRPYYDVVDSWAFGETVDGMIREAMTKPLEFEPGSDFAYSNIGYTLLGEIIQEQSCLSFAGYIMENILLPMGMTSSLVHTVEHTQKENEASGLRWNEQLARHTKDEVVSLPVTSADGGLVTTLDDFIKWSKIYSSASNPVISQESLAALTTPAIPHGSYDWPEEDPRGGVPSYGFGVTISDELLSHSGWIVGFRSHFIFDRETELLIAVFTNNTTNDPLAIANALFRIHEPVTK